MSDYACWVVEANNPPPSEATESERTASLLHQLQTPLTILRLRLENALQSSWCGPECGAVIASCLDDLRGASQMVHDLLLLEKADASQPPATRQAIDLPELVSEVSRDHLALAESKGVSFTLERLPSAKVMGNVHELRRILSNLLGNAVRYTPSGGSIHVRIVLAAGVGAELQISDNGPGIPQEEQSRVFERFYQVAQEADRAQGGVGLGLAIARSLAERNGGRLDLDSTPGKGSTFILRLPLAATDH